VLKKPTPVEDRPLPELVDESKRLHDASENIVSRIQKIAAQIKKKVDALIAKGDGGEDLNSQPVPPPKFTDDKKKPKPR